MGLFRIAACIAVLTGGVALTTSASARAASPITPAANSLKILSADDVSAYVAAFDAVRAGRFDSPEAAKPKVEDPCLLGRLAFTRLMHPDYRAGYAELRVWLDKYRDQPDADRIFALAHKRQPGLSLEAAQSIAADGTPLGLAVTPAVDNRLAAPVSSVNPKQQAAREAYYGGDVEGAFVLAEDSGERWIAGLSAYRLKRFDLSRERFAALAGDRTQPEWVRAAAAFWAARAASAADDPGRVQGFLKLAARSSRTFYGLIAGRALDLARAAQKGAALQSADDDDPASFNGGVRMVYDTEAVSPVSLSRWARGDTRARRVIAYTQVGLRTEAAGELRAALLNAGSDSQRKRWIALAEALGVPVSSPRDRETNAPFDPRQYPAPDLQPTGGFTLQKALVYAIVKQESRFNPAASSGAGAYGLMQITPATAASSAHIAAHAIAASLLLDPATNLRIGQDYVSKLLALTGGDLLRAVASYNAGPRGVMKTAVALPDLDSLLLMESTPGAQTREFVQRVVANYWIYRRMFGQPSPTLDAAANGSRIILASLDRALPDPEFAPDQPPASAGLTSSTTEVDLDAVGR